jgi:hypothetical protein
LVLRCRSVDFGEFVGVGCDEGGGFGGSDGDEVAPDQGEVREEFADFGVGED